MQTVIYAFVGYVLMLFTVRMLSRRPGAQMTPFEFVLVFLIGGVLICASWTTTGRRRTPGQRS